MADSILSDSHEFQQLMVRALSTLDRKYIKRADARQKEMGLAYIEAERMDLARTMARFAAGEVVAELSRRSGHSHRLHEAMAAIKAYLDSTDC